MTPMKISLCYQESYNQPRGSQVWLSNLVPYPKIRPSTSASGSHPGIKPKEGQDKKIRGRQVPCKASCCPLLLLTGSYMTMLIPRAGLTTVFIATDSRPSIFCNAKLKFRVENFFCFQEQAHCKSNQTTSAKLQANTSQLISRSTNRGQEKTDYTRVIFIMRHLLVRWLLEEVFLQLMPANINTSQSAPMK